MSEHLYNVNRNVNRNVTRRDFLGATCLALVGTLAGCSDDRRREFGWHDAEIDPATVGEGGPRSLGEIQATKLINMGIVSDNRPLSGINGVGNYGGFDDYFALWWTERTWIAVNYVAVDPRDRYDRLLSGEVDVCISQMSPADDRAGEVAFANPLYQIQLGIVSPKEAPVTSFDQLGNGALIVCEGSYGEQYARATWPDVELRTYPSFSSARTALEAGAGIALLDEEIPAVWWLKEHKDFTLGMKAVGEARKIAPAVAAGNDDLLEELTKATSSFIDSKWAKRAFEFVVSPDVGEQYVNMLCKLE